MQILSGNRLKISPLLLFLVASIWCTGNLPAQNGMVYFDPDTTYMFVNDSTEIDIAVDSHLMGIHCFIVSIGFDTNLVELTDVLEGPLLPGAGQTFFFWTRTDEGYDIGSCILGFGIYANGPGVIATIKFRSGENGGTSSLHFTSQEFTDTLLNPIYVIPLYGAIVVEDSSSGIYEPDQGTGIPRGPELYQNFPNPFNSRTVIEYDLYGPALVNLQVFDLLGRLEEILVWGETQAGRHAVTWHAEELPSGVYYVRLSAGAHSATRKMLLIK